MDNNLPRRQAVTGYLVSAALHLGILGASIALSVPVWTEFDTSNPAVLTTVSDRSSSPHGEQFLGDVAGLVSPVETQDRAPSPHDLAVEQPPSTDDPGLAEFTRRRLVQAQREAEDQSPAEQRADLETLGKRLQKVASEDSVVELSGTLSKWLGTGERASAPKSSPSSESIPFDIETAQISDVKKVESDEGVKYVAILIDAAGHSTETELDSIDGPQLYETFQLIKKFPLMEMVYRRTVMGLLDKLAREAAPPAESTPPPTAEPDSGDE